MTNPIKLPFLEAIAYFARKLNIPVGERNAIQGEENDWAFAIAGVSNADMLADFRAASDRYIQQGTAFGEFAKEFDTVAKQYGWKPPKGQSIAWRANIVAQTNMRMAYAAGQYQQRQNPAVKKLRPGLMWVHRDSPSFRPHHKALDRKVFDGNDPDYAALSAPSGYGCRCRIFSVPAPSEGYFNLSDQLPYKLPDGKIKQIPAIPMNGELYPIADPGFYYPPGASTVSDRPRLLQQMIKRQPPPLQRAIRRSLPQRIVQKFLPKGFNA